MTDISSIKSNIIGRVFTRQAVTWLSRILYERFGVELLVEIDGRQRLTIRNRFSSGCIVFTGFTTLFTGNSHDTSCAHWNYWEEGFVLPIKKSLPAPGQEKLSTPLVQKTEYGYDVRYNLLELVLWTLTRHEEQFCSQFDHHGRVPHHSSHAARYDYLHRPIVDEWLEILKQIVEMLWPSIGFVLPTPKNAITCDVDRPYSGYVNSIPLAVKKVGKDILRNLDLSSAANTFLNYYLSKIKNYKYEPYHTFDWIMDVNERYGNLVTFYFMVNQVHTEYDSYYCINEPRVRRLLHTISKRGHNIGLHPSYITCEDQNLLVREINVFKRVLEEEKITQSSLAVRHHYLRWSHSFSQSVFEEAGFTYDSSLGYADYPGFRCGTCHDYTMFDLANDRMLRLKQRPLVMMEISVLDHPYLEMGYSQEAFQFMQAYKNTCREFRGTFTLLWHNCHLEKLQDRDFYQQLIKN